LTFRQIIWLRLNQPIKYIILSNLKKFFQPLRAGCASYSPVKSHEAKRRYMLHPKVYHEIARAFLAFQGFHPSSATESNVPMQVCIQKYQNHMNLESQHTWRPGADTAQVSVDWSSGLNSDADTVDNVVSHSGPVVQLSREGSEPMGELALPSSNSGQKTSQ